MKEEKDLLAYCGIYCGDCLGYTGVIADAAEPLINVLEKYKFDQTVTHIFPEKLKDYETGHQLLKFMANLRCPEVCRKRDSISCTVRECCRTKVFMLVMNAPISKGVKPSNHCIKDFITIPA